jgi:antagonist of KipI
MNAESKGGVTVLRSGLLTTVQDAGRFGYQQYGVNTAGPMDPFAFQVANLLVGNEEREAALEMTLLGPTLHFEAGSVIALCGGRFTPSIENIPVPDWRPVFVRRGSEIKIGQALSGCCAYLAVAGGFYVPLVMGSRSTSLSSKLGGFQGRALREGDRLPFRSPERPAPEWIYRRRSRSPSAPFIPADWGVSEEALPAYRPDPTLRVLRGRQWDRFTPEARQAFLELPFLITPQSNRMGYRLSGPKLYLKTAAELISEATAMGTVQVTPSGDPIVLLADRPVTGGYPKIAEVITVDLPLIAQVPPGQSVRFQEVSLREAQQLLAYRMMDLRLLKGGIALHAG